VDPVNAMNEVRHAMAAGRPSRNSKPGAGGGGGFAHDDVQHCEAIGRHGAKLIRSGMKVLTHCNAGWLAFVDIGSATAPMYAAQAQEKSFTFIAMKPVRVRKARR
jgi:methylthioribose-1-phosphate isomerase